jgi:hypothetical protein
MCSPNRMGAASLVSSKRLFQDALALDLGRTTQIEAFKKQQVEGVEDHVPLASGREGGLKLGEVGPAVLHDRRLAVEDRPLDRDVERAGNRRETLRPVQPGTGIGRHPALVRAI